MDCLRWLAAAVWVTCLFACTQDRPVAATGSVPAPASSASGSVPAPASSATAAASPSARATAPRRSARITAAFVVPKPKDKHRRIFGLIPCAKAWCAGVESASAKPGSKWAPDVSIGRISEQGLIKQADGPRKRRLTGVAASARSESPWWFYGELADKRYEVFAVQRGGSAKALFTAAGGDAIRFDFNGHAEIAWVAADPPRGIVYWQNTLTDKRKRSLVTSGRVGGHYRPKITGYEHYVFTVSPA